MASYSGSIGQWFASNATGNLGDKRNIYEATIQPGITGINACGMSNEHGPEFRHLSARSITFQKYLCGLHGLHRGPFKKSRLVYRIQCINLMDLAIVREGGVHNMPVDALRNACFMRGLNAANMSTDDLILWLRGWVEVSSEVGEECISLLLHLPILLCYNHPNNWHLVYKGRWKADKQQTKWYAFSM